MKPLKSFGDFLKEGIAKKQAVDFSRANFLIDEAEKSFDSVKEMAEKLSITDRNANSIVKLCYDVIMELVRAKMLTKGLSASGQGAHEAEVSYFREMGFSEVDVQFLDQLRYFRNSITYYGKILDSEYATKVFNFLERIYPKIKKALIV